MARKCVILDDDLEAFLFDYVAKMIKSTGGSYSFSKALNVMIRRAKG